MIAFAILCSIIFTSPVYTFEVQHLSDTLKTEMIETGVWKPGCPVEIDRLRLVKFVHYDFVGDEKQGQIIVLEAVAERVMQIFKTLHQHKFPIAQAKTMDEYFGLDKPSMAANNTSAFNYRPIAGKTFLSVHSYGVAIDVNPIQNPCIELKEMSNPEEVWVAVQPAGGQGYLNRTNVRSGMVEQVIDETTGLRVVDLYNQNGFYVWGGKWNDPVDWQHFQPSRAAAEWLGFMRPEHATDLFELYIPNPKLLNDATVRSFDFKSLYEKNPQRFMLIINSDKFMNLSPKDAYDKF